MKKNVLCILLGMIMMVALFTGCDSASSGQSESPSSPPESVDTGDTGDDAAQSTGVVLEWETTATSEKTPTYQDIIDSFSAETGIEIELVTPGNDYETVMKTRMASGDLPDIWETHGWSVARYSEYLATLNDQSWYEKVDDSILPVISDDGGNIYCLPLTIGVNTISYNKTVFEQAGVTASDIRTWDDFNEACEKIKGIGVTPIFCGNKDSSTIAQFCESIPPAFLTTDSVEDNQIENLKNGTFDWQTYWTPIAQLVDGWMQAGYFNEDILTSDNDAACQALANDECGMVFGGGNNVLFARIYNPEADLGYLACPAATEDGQSFLSMGEGTCIGIWKDTEYADECRQFLDYLSAAETCSLIATVSGDIPGLTDAENEDAYVTQAFRETCSLYEGDIQYVPLFDREYLPSGMWDDLGVAMTKIIMDPGNAVDESVDYLQEAYTTKMAQ